MTRCVPPPWRFSGACAEEPREAIGNAPGLLWLVQPTPGLGTPSLRCPWEEEGYAHPPTPPSPRKELRSPEYRSPARAEPPTPTGLPRLAATQQTLELLLAAVLGCPCPGAGGRVCGGGPTLSWTGRV